VAVAGHSRVHLVRARLWKETVELRSSWLFLLMVVAAGSVTVFGCIGIAAITGHLPAARVGVVAFAESTSPTDQAAAKPELASDTLPSGGPGRPVDDVAVKTTEATSKPAAARKKVLDRTVN